MRNKVRGVKTPTGHRKFHPHSSQLSISYQIHRPRTRQSVTNAMHPISFLQFSSPTAYNQLTRPRINQIPRPRSHSIPIAQTHGTRYSIPFYPYRNGQQGFSGDKVSYLLTRHSYHASFARFVRDRDMAEGPPAGAALPGGFATILGPAPVKGSHSTGTR